MNIFWNLFVIFLKIFRKFFNKFLKYFLKIFWKSVPPPKKNPGYAHAPNRNPVTLVVVVKGPSRNEHNNRKSISAMESNIGIKPMNSLGCFFLGYRISGIARIFPGREAPATYHAPPSGGQRGGSLPDGNEV